MATKITIADLFPDDEGMILVAKDAVDGSPRHISQVINGAACGCVCFGCGRRLIARNGGDPVVRAHSFAHRPEDMVVDCTSSGETALHIRAKEIIARHCRVTLPETSVLDLDGKRLVVSPERSIDLTAVHLETAEGEVIPDVVATMPDGRRLFIEIANTHPCPPEKIGKLDAMGVDVLEIDVSRYRSYTLDDLDEIILDVAKRKLIHSAAVKALVAKLAEERRRQDETKLAEAERLVAVYRDPMIRNHMKAQAQVDELVSLGFSDFLDLDDDRPSAFIVYRRQWQAVVFDRLFKARSSVAIGAMDVVNSFSKGGWPKKEIVYTKSEYSQWIAANVAEEFKSPYEEILAYLKRLQKAGAVYQIPGKRFAMSHDLCERITAAIEKLKLPEKQRKQLLAAYRGIGALMRPEDGTLPDFDIWLESRAGYFGLTVDELLADADGDFDELIDQVDGVKEMIIAMQGFQDVEPPDEMAGLPMGGLINRLGLARLEVEERVESAQAARLKREEEAHAARLKREADERVAEIIEAAEWEFDDASPWLATPLSEHGGKTPLALTAEGPDGLKKVHAVIQRIRDDKRELNRADDLRKTMVGRLYDAVYDRIPRRDLADLWLMQSWPKLGGVRATEYCVDEKTLKLCLEVLEEFVSNDRKQGRR